MAITLDDFDKVWASESPLTPYEFNDSQYKQGWNFVGGTPPSRQMWDFLQKNNDEKLQYLANNYLPLSGGTLTGVVNGVTPTAGDDTTKLATTAYVQDELLNYLPLSGGTLTGVVNGVTPTAGDDTTKLATTAYVQEEIRQHGSLPVGHEYFSMNPNVPQGSLPLIGGVYSRETYADLWSWVQEQTGYLKTEAEWQALSTSNNGNVPFYSDGDGSTTFRVPSLHCWIKGSDGSAQLVGSYLQAGLPNITGRISTGGEYGFDAIWNVDNRGAFNTSTASQIGWEAVTAQNSVASKSSQALFDASLSNPIYGNANTVQPESIVGMWLVKAYGTVTNAGSTDVANISTGLTQAETRISTAETRISTAETRIRTLENHDAGAVVVKTYRNGTEWYRVWSDGWVEQGGIVPSMPTGNGNNTTNYSTITLPKAFADTDYIVSVMVNSLTKDSGVDTIVTLNQKNTTNFKTRNFDSSNAIQVSASWFACGQGV